MTNTPVVHSFRHNISKGMFLRSVTHARATTRGFFDKQAQPRIRDSLFVLYGTAVYETTDSYCTCQVTIARALGDISSTTTRRFDMH
jgi:hypothetical protein